MAFNAGRVEVSLGAQLERRDFELYERKLKEIRQQVAKKEQFKAELGADYNPRAFNAYQRELNRTKRETDDNIRTQGRLRTAFGSVYGSGGALFAAAGGLAGLGIALKSVVTASGEAEVSQRKMVAQLKASGISYQAHAKQIDEVIQKTSQLAGLDDEDLQDAFTNIVRVTGDVNKSLRLTGLAADFARAKHIDVAKAGELVGKVAGGNTGILSRYGIQVEKGASATEALGVLQQKFRGQAEAYGRTQQGALDRVDVAFENLRETIGKRLAPTITNAANRLATFIDQMSTGRGAGGRFVDRMREVSEQMQSVGRQFVNVAKRAQGHESTILKVAAAYFTLRGRLVRAGAALLAAVGIDKTKKQADSVEDVRKRIAGLVATRNLKGLEALGETMRKAADLGVHHAKELAREVRRATRDVRRSLDFDQLSKQLDNSFKFMRNTTRGHMRDIRRTVSQNTDIIRQRLGDDTAEGRKALAQNFRQAARQVKRSMDAGVISTRTGTSEIRDLLIRGLEALGLSNEQAKAKLKTGTIQTDRGPGAGAGRRAGGGWIGGRGLISGDVVPVGDAVAAFGEYLATGPGGRAAVLNRHQAPVADLMLAAGGYRTLDQGADLPTLEMALAPIGGLNALFAAITRPHYLARGGNANLMGAKPGLAGYAQLASQFGLRVTSGARPGSITSSGNVSLHSSGDAIDVDAGSPGAMLAYAKAMASRFGSGLDELIHTPLGFGIKNGRRVPPYATADHYDHVHVGDRTPGGAGGLGVLPRIVAAVIGGSGALRGLVQRGSDVSAATGNQTLRRVFDSMGISGDYGTGTARLTGGQYSKSQLAALWRRAGGDPKIANLMAAIALAESGGNPRAHNPSGASGLWQILGLPFPGDVYNPLTNARMAVAKYQSQGLRAWEVYTNGSYRQYLARGGRASKRKRPRATAAERARDYIRPLRTLQTDRIGDYEAELGRVDDLNIAYSIRERTYDLDTEELIREDGTVDVKAVEERANELAGLASIRARIVEAIRRAIRVVRRVVKTYNTILRRLRRSLKHASKKDRAGVRGLISTYEGRLEEWRGTLKDLTQDKLPNASLDLRELLRERREVLGTRAEAADTGDIGDTGEEDLGTDTDIGGSDTTETTAPPTAADIAAAAAQEFQNYLSGAQELFKSFGANYLTPAGAFGAGGIFSGAPDLATMTAGLRGFGATGSGGLGGVTGAPIIVVQQGGSFAQFATAPDDGPTFVSQVRFQVESAAG